MICDIKISAKELVRFKSFDLTELTAQILKQTRFDLDFDQIRNMYRLVKFYVLLYSVPFQHFGNGGGVL